ncbi:uncharacterized protein [Henckelia pumila]|uniref:uncharacterized protein n=1 Tax=Henckelia pumila TaxID=405737 RepID=UPI003C6E16DA
MTHDQIDPEFAIFSDMIRIVDLPANALIDTGATHSFISVKFMMKLGIMPDESVSGFSVSLLSGRELKSNQVVRDCKIQMQGLDMYADFIVLEMEDFNIILGMDWLTRHEAFIECKQRTMLLKLQNGELFVFYVAAKRSLSGVISAEVEVVKDFPEVFPDDVAGLPPVREVKFGIELLPGTKPASKEPYRLTLTEMKELKDQLQESLDKGFIKPSVSP